MLIWVGQFNSEADFNKYMDQSLFFQWSKVHDESNKNLSCQFCKELGITNYEPDFIIIKYAHKGISELLNLIPADTDKIKQVLYEKNIEIANVAILYNCHEGISSKIAENTTSVSYIGTFSFEINPIGNKFSTAGLRYMTWIGNTNMSKKEFLEYFDQDKYLKEIQDYESGQSKKRPNMDSRCQFCKDLGIKLYYPEFLRISIGECRINAVKLIQTVIQDDKIPQRWIEDSLKDSAINDLEYNCAFCYIPNGFREKKKDQKIFILKESMKGLLGIPKKYINELNAYNGIKYLSTFKWE